MQNDTFAKIASAEEQIALIYNHKLDNDNLPQEEVTRLDRLVASLEEDVQIAKQALRDEGGERRKTKRAPTEKKVKPQPVEVVTYNPTGPFSLGGYTCVRAPWQKESQELRRQLMGKTESRSAEEERSYRSGLALGRFQRMFTGEEREQIPLLEKKSCLDSFSQGYLAGLKQDLPEMEA